MSYIVFARKYRPQTFDDVVGQSHITTTLKNAIAQSRVAHAYIFAGPRGVGKTTTARVFAKALNCEKGPTPKPCNKCASCKEITQGSSLDILEIDGASNRGIEEIRSLRENIKFAPSKGHFKTYIIDEVHMLTPEAFNALLKTLEEPPPHVKFIFATTSPHKVPATILSRCQRFDFRRIPTKDILENLRKIVKDESLNVKDEALMLIAKYGDGSMRDAQVILDQISSFSEGKVGVEDVTKILGIVDDDILFGLSDAIKRRDPAGALAIIDKVINDGKDVVQVVLGLIEHFRNISVAKIGAGENVLIDAGPDKIKQYSDESRKFTIEEMLYIIYTLSNTIDFIRKSTLARIPFEAAIVKLTQVGYVVPLAEVISRLEALENGIKSSGPVSAGAHSSRAPEPARSPGPQAFVAPAQPACPAESPARAPAPLPAEAKREAVAEQDCSPASSKGLVDLDDVTGCWAKVISYIRPRKISVASYLDEGFPTALDGATLTIGFPKSAQFHKEVLDSPDNRKFIEEVIREVLGFELRVSFSIVDPAAGKGKGGGSSSGSAALGEGGTGADDDPIVKAAMEMFGGKVSGNSGALGGQL